MPRTDGENDLHRRQVEESLKSDPGLSDELVEEINRQLEAEKNPNSPEAQRLRDAQDAERIQREERKRKGGRN